MSDIFSYLSPEPIAAASLAEVYDGRLKSTGERVAVKLQYIDLQDRFAGDMLTIRLILYALGSLFPKFDFGWMLESVTQNLERELNFKLEGQNADRCYAQLSPHLKYIYVPKICWEYTTSRVLVMEFIDGFKVSEVDKIKQANLSLKQVDTRVVEAMAFQIFHSGFVHADPHVNERLSAVNSMMKLLCFCCSSQEISMFDKIPTRQTNQTPKSSCSITDCTKRSVRKIANPFVNFGNPSC